jgi:hypothetical protein
MLMITTTYVFVASDSLRLRRFRSTSPHQT